MKLLESTAGAMHSMTAHSHHHVSLSPICRSHPYPHRPICLHRESDVSVESVNAKGTSLATVTKRCRRCSCSASAQPYSSNSASGKGKVVGMGLACWDYLAQVSSFPQPDEKIRTLQLQTRGGGNAGNALTAACRLGADCYLVTKLGDDGIGDQIASELKGDGVNLQFVLRAKESVSDFTYLIIDKSGGTRTCIQTHSDNSEYSTKDLQPERIDQILADASLVYFDGRLTQAATQLAKAARSRGIPVLVEAERLRPGLEALLQEADYICTSAHFPKLWTKEATLGDAMLACLGRLPHVQWMITTLGKRGSALVHRSHAAPDASSAVLDEKLNEMLQHVSEHQPLSGDFEGCTTSDGLPIRSGHVSTMEHVCQLQYTRQHAGSVKGSASDSSSTQAGAAHTDAASHHSTGTTATATATHQSHSSCLFGQVTVASAAALPQGAVQDTTGAGDAFIGTVLYGITHGLPLERMLKLAALVAASGCTGLGSRPALPRAHQISPELLLP